MKKRYVSVNDSMQKGYRYALIEPVGKNFDPSFAPQLTPKQMLKLGVFGGKYLTDCQKEFPSDWFEQAKLSYGAKDPKLNYFGVNASQSLAVWRKKGWIHPQDPRGWFQWYCRYYLGRRTPSEDKRQIQRWENMRRHVVALKKYCQALNLSCRKRQRQALLHWAYDSRRF